MMIIAPVRYDGFVEGKKHPENNFENYVYKSSINEYETFAYLFGIKVDDETDWQTNEALGIREADGVSSSNETNT